MRLGFIGLGKMGRPMAETLLRAGFHLTVHNRSQSVVDELVRQGAQRAGSPAETASESDLLMICLVEPEVVEATLVGPEGAIRGAHPGQIIVDFSTIEPRRSRSIAETLAKSELSFLDAPVSGGPPAAEAGRLTILVGGERDTFQKAEPVLRILGDKIFHLGPTGSGSLAKACNQIMTAVHQALACEVMVMGAKGGLDPCQLYEALRAGSAQSRGLERAIPNFVLRRTFEAKATIDLIIKDLQCGLETASELGARQVIAPLAQQLYLEARSLGHGQKDIAAVILAMEDYAGCTVSSPRGEQVA